MAARAWVGRTLAVACVLSAPAIFWIYWSRDRVGEMYPEYVLHNILLGGVGLGILCLLAFRTQATNGVVWALLVAAVFQVSNAWANAWSVVILEDAGIDERLLRLPFSEVPASADLPLWLGAWTWIPGIFILGIMLPLLFPDGRLPSRRWRWLLWGSVGLMLTSAVGFTRAMLDVRSSSILVGDMDPIETYSWLALLGLLGSVLVAVGVMIRRFRASEGEERDQFRWVGWGAGLFGIGMVALIPDLSGSSGAGGIQIFPLVSLITGTLFVVALTVAITRFRLYGIGTVLNRTVSIVALGTIITGLYVAIVAGLTSILGGSSGPDGSDSVDFDIQVIGAVVVAMAFQPVRRWAKGWANRLVFGRRVTPYEVLSRFSRGAAASTGLDTLDRIPQLIVDGTVATSATIWVAEEAGLAPLASHPEGDREPLPVGGEFSDPGADHSLPVFHRGELLGGISLVSQGETFPPSEVELVEDLSAGLGLVLHNAGLTRRLQEQVDALEASRERVLAAADSARRSLEQDLDSGPQQQLVALKVMLGPTRVLAEQAGAEKTAGVLAQLEDEAGDAIRAVREFSGGVYPPLLEAEGLAAAMAERVGRATLPVAFRADGVGRFPREVEAAVYFTVLEALQNAAKYAEPSSVEVVLEQADGRVQFRVSDDGVGFDESTTVAGSGLANMSDRIDAVGGSLEIASLPGEGTTVSGSVPV